MFKKLAIAATLIVAAVAFTSQAEAGGHGKHHNFFKHNNHHKFHHNHNHHKHHHHHKIHVHKYVAPSYVYFVYYIDHCGQWQVYGKYHSLHTANSLLLQFKHLGYQAAIKKAIY